MQSKLKKMRKIIFFNFLLKSYFIVFYSVLPVYNRMLTDYN